MKLLVLGATGGTGGQLVRRALAAGHRITALVRRPGALDRHAGLREVVGDVLDPRAAFMAASGQDAVVSALGTQSRAATTLYSGSTRNVIDAMREHRIRRFLGVTAGAYVQDPADPAFIRLLVKPLLTTLLREPYADMQRMEALLRSSGLDWTLLRPARLTDGPATGRYRVVVDGSVPGGWVISRADLADFIVGHLNAPDLHGHAVSLAR